MTLKLFKFLSSMILLMESMLPAKTSATIFLRKPSEKYFCPDDVVILEEEGYLGDIQCSYRCAKISECLSVVFRPVKGVCYGCSSEFEISDADIEPNYQHVRRFWLVKEPMNWDAAKINCEDLGGHLANVNTEEKQLSVNETLSNADVSQVWLGGNDRDVEGKFVWTDGTTVSDGFENWKYGEPNNKSQDQHCLDIVRTNYNTWRWDDTYCSLSYPSLCEF